MKKENDFNQAQCRQIRHQMAIKSEKSSVFSFQMAEQRNKENGH